DADADALKQEAAGKIQGFFKELGGTLKGSMEKGGPVEAIGACNDKAPGISSKHSEGGWTVARTSLKLRNDKNAPDAWEAKVLNDFDARKAKGEDPAKIAYGEVVDEGGKKVFRFMKAIPTAELCLKCHGRDIDPVVAGKLDTLYPNDKARGYKPGDLRGAFTLKKAL
ncbi:MAG: DUF3365 domain-containing protein, partial [Rhodospirillales bacterium]|nr:DUF3365 domain-containing protein [Rhodospirillales bacterium]MCW8861631.1 DUF3365 domain-containing protein [Rhodospirillales bacterium]MCW8970794.1 DUF3365 domain-containing protein [Rhodospirillales bacterium]MCW9001241.1 DUF3365 domain-containing protein [Rhodospirillales bacterium]